MKPSFSIAVSNYNHGRYLEDVFTRIFPELPLDGEIVVVDDGSTDQSRDVLEKAAREDARVKVLYNERNRGINFTVNRAVDATQSDIIAIISVDDLIMPGYITKALEAFKRYPGFPLVISNLGVIYEDRPGWNPTQIHAQKTVQGITEMTSLTPKQLVHAMRKGFYIGGPTRIMKREAFYKYGGSLETVYSLSDWLLASKIGFAEGLIYIPETLYVQRITGENYFLRIARNKQKKKEANFNFLAELAKPEYRQVRQHFRKSHSLSFGNEVFWNILCKHPRYYDFLPGIASNMCKRKLMRPIKRILKKLI